MQDIINAELLKYDAMDDPKVVPSNPTTLEVMGNKRAAERTGSTSLLETCYEHLLNEYIEISKLDPATQITRLSAHLEGLHINLPLKIYWNNAFALSKLDSTTRIGRLSTHLEGLHSNLPLIIYWDNVFALSNMIEDLIYLRRLYRLPDKWIDIHASTLGMEHNRINVILNNGSEVRKLCLLRDKKTTPEYYHYARAIYKRRKLDMLRSMFTGAIFQ